MAEQITLQNNGANLLFEMVELKGRKPKALSEKMGDDASTVLAPTTPDASTLTSLVAFVGADLFFKKLWTMVLRPAAVDAYCEALNEEGKLNGPKFTEEFCQFFKETVRKSGGAKKSDLEAEVMSLNPDFLQAFKTLQTNKNLDGSVLAPEQRKEVELRAQRLCMKIEELNNKIAQKERKTRKKEEAAGVTN